MPPDTSSNKQTEKAATYPQIAFDPGDWQPVYKSQQELNAAMDAFGKAVSADVRLFAEARRLSAELLWKGE